MSEKYDAEWWLDVARMWRLVSDVDRIADAMETLVQIDKIELKRTNP